MSEQKVSDALRRMDAECRKWHLGGVWCGPANEIIKIAKAALPEAEKMEQRIAELEREAKIYDHNLLQVQEYAEEMERYKARFLKMAALGIAVIQYPSADPPGETHYRVQHPDLTSGGHAKTAEEAVDAAMKEGERG